MEPKSSGADPTREWLLALERRVSELERARLDEERRRRRSFWLMAAAVVLYVLLFLQLTSGL